MPSRAHESNRSEPRRCFHVVYAHRGCEEKGWDLTLQRERSSESTHAGANDQIRQALYPSTNLNLRGHSRSNRDSTYGGDDFRVEPLHQKNCLGAMGLTLNPWAQRIRCTNLADSSTDHARWMGSQWRYTRNAVATQGPVTPKKTRAQPCTVECSCTAWAVDRTASVMVAPARNMLMRRAIGC